MSFFYPVLRYITAVTQGQTTVVTLDQNHDFTIGELISFRVSPPFGMVELNNLVGLVLSFTPNTITVNINSLNWTAFVNAGTFVQTPAVAVPAGSGVIPGAIPPQTNLFDAFDNVPTT